MYRKTNECSLQTDADVLKRDTVMHSTFYTLSTVKVIYDDVFCLCSNDDQQSTSIVKVGSHGYPKPAAFFTPAGQAIEETVKHH